MLMVYLDHIHMARIENYLISLCKARILAASACTCKNKGRAREGKDACFRTSSLFIIVIVTIMNNYIIVYLFLSRGAERTLFVLYGPCWA